MLGEVPEGQPKVPRDVGGWSVVGGPHWGILQGGGIWMADALGPASGRERPIVQGCQTWRVGSCVGETGWRRSLETRRRDQQPVLGSPEEECLGEPQVRAGASRYGSSSFCLVSHPRWLKEIVRQEGGQYSHQPVVGYRGSGGDVSV